MLWLRSRRLLVSCRRVAAFPWHDGLSPSCDRRQWRAVLWQESVARRSGAGSARTHCVRGAIAAGYSPRDPQFARKAGRVMDLYQRRWKGAALGRRESSVLSVDEKTSIQARRRKHRSLPPRRGLRSMLSTNTPEPARWPTSLRGTCSEPSCSAAASARTASPRSSASSFRSCASNRIVRRVACS